MRGQVCAYLVGHGLGGTAGGLDVGEYHDGDVALELAARGLGLDFGHGGVDAVERLDRGYYLLGYDGV